MDFHSFNKLDDLQLIEENELPLFCNDLRAYIIEEILKQGGHFAANLGVVELTVALLRKFSPKNHPYIWDVGHQSYPYKILTDRKNEISHIRSYSGISGFPKITESNYDFFGTGHSSTALSAAMGMAWSRKSETNDPVIAIVGDGALTGGMTFEALNNIKNQHLNVIIIFNDNGMGIDPNAGAVHQASNEMLKQWFEFYGLNYQGPIDGHNLSELTNSLNILASLNGPQLLHVKTIKGKGYLPAESEQTKWHSTPKYVKVDPQKTAAKSWHQAFGDAMMDLAEKYPNIYGITPAMPSSSGLAPLLKKFPERFIDVTIAEQHALTFAAGIAASGKKPFVAIYSTFLQRAYDQFIHDIALQRLPVVLCIDRAGLVGEDGPTHHGVFDLAFLLPIPDVEIWSPATETELIHALEHAYIQQHPVCIRYPKGALPQLTTDFSKPFTWMHRSDNHNILCITTGKSTSILGEIAEHLKQLDVSWLHVQQVKPFPQIHDNSQYKHIITIEDGSIIGGMGNYIHQGKFLTADEWHFLGTPDRFIPHGSNQELYQEAGFSSMRILEKIQELMPN